MRTPAAVPEEAGSASPVTVDVRLQGPLDVAVSLEPFRRSGDDLMDRWDGIHLVRTIPVGNASVAYACTVDGTLQAPVLCVTVEDPSLVHAVRRAVGSTFVQPPPEFAALLERDAIIAELNRRFPGLRPVLQFDLLGALVRSVSAQQVNLRWAVTTRRRLAEAFGERHLVAGHPVYSLSATRLAAASVEAIRALQFTTRKAEYIIGVAQAIAGGRLDMPSLAALADDEVIARLTALRGIGLWTAEWILARVFGRPRVVAGDLGVRKAVGLAYLHIPLASEAEVREATAHWGPSAGIAQALLLHSLSSGAAAL